jgi:phosphate:Na+ symporter
MGSIVLLDLMGGVALLLWGLHMVRSGIMRAFGSELRRVLGTALRNRFLALLAGIGVTALLQSSTATGLLMTSFAARGLVDLVPALAVMLGANIGTTLIVQALSFDISAVAPVLFLVGLLTFNFGGRRLVRDLGRVAIGLGLMLLSLHILLDTLAPGRECSRCTRTSCRDHRRARVVRPDRRCAHLGGPFQRGGGIARHVARLFAVRESRRGPRARARR